MIFIISILNISLGFQLRVYYLSRTMIFYLLGKRKLYSHRISIKNLHIHIDSSINSLYCNLSISFIDSVLFTKLILLSINGKLFAISVFHIILPIETFICWIIFVTVQYQYSIVCNRNYKNVVFAHFEN